jgi:integrase
MIQTITEDELKQIVAGTPTPHHQLAFMLGFYQCMNISEIIKLKPEDLDNGQKLIRINKPNGKNRNITIQKQVRKYLRYLPIPCGPRSLEIAFKAISRRVLNKDTSFRTLRRSGAMRRLNAYELNPVTKQHEPSNLRALQIFLGHSSIGNTKRLTRGELKFA